MAEGTKLRPFSVASDGVDPSRVPHRTLSSGATIPVIGLGTFGSDRFSGEQVAAAVLEAAEVGYRHFDCASVYGNEHLIGGAFRAILDGGVARRDLWITSKLWNDKHGEDDVEPSCRQSLQDLGLDDLDLYLVHWPFPNYHPPGCDVTARSNDAKPYIHEAFMKTWRRMEALVDAGLVRHIGTSNMTIPKLELLLRDARIKPACNEMELHPHFQQPELFQFVVDAGIVPIGYSPIGSPNRPERDRTEDDTVDVEDRVIVRIAERLGVHPGTVCLLWAVRRGQIPIPFSVKRPQFLSALKVVCEDSLTDQDMRDIAGIDRGCRLIKGQVFLWKEGQSWEDLWDPNGVITPP
ncbi:aldo/keto reductase [Paludisphaera rhizosphaerae]|uniref:aldo/keto reductase n=1 Tax=Paludisphaera rhizosphaerae TaxID=2711216 RepID=UPI0019812CB4|nr:aldo/keto reductase [Paludisphaera rhizosphaerae]